MAVNSKKGMLMAGVAIVFAFILSYAVVVFLVDRSVEGEGLKLGQMLIDVYAAEDGADDMDYYVQKAGEYALLKGLKKNIEAGLVGNVECDAFFEDGNCPLGEDYEEIAKGVVEHVEEPFDEYIKLVRSELTAENYKFETKLEEGYLVLSGVTEIYSDFGKNFEREMKFERALSFESKIKFDFSEYSEVSAILLGNIACFKSSDISLEDDIGDCLEDPRFSEVSKDGEDLLSFNYKVKGILFEDEFNGPLVVDLKHLPGNINMGLEEFCSSSPRCAQFEEENIDYCGDPQCIVYAAGTCKRVGNSCEVYDYFPSSYIQYVVIYHPQNHPSSSTDEYSEDLTIMAEFTGQVPSSNKIDYRLIFYDSESLIVKATISLNDLELNQGISNLYLETRLTPEKMKEEGLVSGKYGLIIIVYDNDKNSAQTHEISFSTEDYLELKLDSI